MAAANRTQYQSRKDRKDGILAVLISSPVMLFITLFSLLPFAASFLLCFTDYALVKQQVSFVGLKNFEGIINNRSFWQTIEATLTLSLGSIACTVLLGMFYAVVLSFDIPGKSVLKAIVLLPWVVPELVAGYVWKMMFTTDFGWVYHWLVRFGVIDAGTGLFTHVAVTRWIVIACFAWRSAPFMSIMLYAQLKTLPTDQIEASRIDGANALQGFFHITLPWLMPVLKRCSLLQYVWAFNSFTIIYALTSGGPGIKTATLPFMMQQTAFTNFMFGKGSAYAVIILLLLGLSLAALFGLRTVWRLAITREVKS